jgi:hypothetical protein
VWSEPRAYLPLTAKDIPSTATPRPTVPRGYRFDYRGSTGINGDSQPTRGQAILYRLAWDAEACSLLELHRAIDLLQGVRGGV